MAFIIYFWFHIMGNYNYFKMKNRICMNEKKTNLYMALALIYEFGPFIFIIENFI